MGTTKIEDIYPLTPTQQGILFHYLYTPDSRVYFLCLNCTLHGDLQQQALQEAWEYVISRHSILRTIFTWERRDTPLQIVLPRIALPWLQLDWQMLSAKEQQEQLAVYLQQDQQSNFTLTHTPPLRLALICLAKQRYQLIFSSHHILLDGWSLTLLLQEIITCYHAIRSHRPILLPRPRLYRDYVAWLQQQNTVAAEAWWRATLAGFTTPTRLFVDKEPDALPGLHIDMYEQRIRIDYVLTSELQSLARKYHLTLNTLIQVAWSYLLYRCSGETDVLFGITVAGRPSQLSGAEAMIGLFINTIPMRVQLKLYEPLIAQLQEVQRHQAITRQYEYCSLTQIKTWSDVPAEKTLFETLLVFQNFPAHVAWEQDDHLRVVNTSDKEGTHYPLTLLVKSGEELELILSYTQTRFDNSSIEAMLTYLQDTLTQFVAKPTQCMIDIPLLTNFEQQELQVTQKVHMISSSTEQFCHQLIEARAKLTPDALAVVYAEQALTFQEIDRRANQLAQALHRRGIGPDCLVGICMERSLEMAVAIYGCMKTGGAYVSLDPFDPPERLHYIIRDAAVSLILTQQHLHALLDDTMIELLYLDTHWHVLAQATDRDITHTISVQEDNLAYIIYTSGSTGRPKGVMSVHGGLINRLRWMQDTYQLTACDKALQKTPFSFDVSVWEFLWPLITGACLIIAKPEGHKDSAYLVDLIAKENITILHFVPSMLQMFLDEFKIDHYTSLRRVICSGETLSHELQQRFFKCMPAQVSLCNLYGPTEASIDVSYWNCEHDSTLRMVPIGFPISNVQLYIANHYLHLLPKGIPGELYIGGSGLARGYLQRPDLTADYFIPHPFSKQPDARLYKTGDLARYLPSGAIEFLGRLDHQVKIRGVRIELGEIEHVLAQHPNIHTCAVIAREDTPGEKRLVAYVVLTEDVLLEREALRTFLQHNLPDYMLPSAFVFLSGLPLLPNGKVDRKALLAPSDDRSSLATEYIAPRSPVEQLVADIWADALKMKQVGANDNFFHLGGHSLLAMRVIGRVREVFQKELSLRVLFEAPTLAAFARELSVDCSVPLQVETITRRKNVNERPLSLAQERLYFLDQLEPNSNFYNITLPLCVNGPLNIQALQQSLTTIVQRHESLRTTFAVIDSLPVQVIAPSPSLAFQLIDCSSLSVTLRHIEGNKQAQNEIQRPFHLMQGPLFRVCLLRISEHEHVLLLTLHHIICDEWSIGLLYREITQFYTAIVSNQPIQMPELPIQYVDYAHWQREWLQGDVLETQLAYWLKQLANLPTLELPVDYPRPRIQTYRGDHHRFVLSEQSSALLTALSRKTGVTLFMAFLALFQLLLQRYSGQNDIVVGTPVADRTRGETRNLIGFFVNTLVLRTNLSGNPTFYELLQRVRTIMLEAFSYQSLPFKKLVDELQPVRDLSRSPLFQVMFVLHDPSMETMLLPDLTFSRFEVDNKSSKFDLSLYIEATDHGFTGTVEYNSDLFSLAAIERLVGHFQILLHGVITNPDQPIQELPLLTPAELQELLVIRNTTHAHYAKDTCVHHLFEEQVERTPEAIALIDGMQYISYQTLNRRANQIARLLVAKGIGPEVLVGLYMERSLEMVIGLLAILKAGGAYLPLDPAYPHERFIFLVQDAQISVLLTLQRFMEKISQANIQIICVDIYKEQEMWQQDDNIMSAATSNNLLYAIYTSGSTGRPKGVLGCHRGTINRLQWMWQTYPFESHEICCQKTALGFVDSVWEIFGPLLQGLSLLLVDPETLKDLSLFVQILAQYSVTRLVLVPSLLHLLLENFSDIQQRLPMLKWWTSSGEVLSLALLHRFKKQLPYSYLLNLYGSSEVAADVAACEVAHLSEALAYVSLGRPIANTQIYLFDGSLQPVPLGIAGEIYVSGDSLARGYLGHPEWTAGRFLPHPFSSEAGDRLYKTGDLARFRSDGGIEFLGRIDHQVKIRGIRIETGEVETVLKQHSDIRECVIRAQNDFEGNRYLVAYIVPQADQAPPINDLRAFLLLYLPDYMVPTAFLFLDSLPLTASGKVNRMALPQVDRSYNDTEEESYVAPRNAIEATLAQIFTDVIGVERVGIYDNFFDLGGDSLLILQVSSKIVSVFQVEIPIRDLFDFFTVASLADIIVLERSINERE